MGTRKRDGHQEDPESRRGSHGGVDEEYRGGEYMSGDGQIIVDTLTLSKVMRSMPAVEDSPEPGSSPSKSAPDSYVTLLCRYAR